MGNAVAQTVGLGSKLPFQQQGPAYHRIQLRGTRGTLLWGYHEAAEFRSWRIWKDPQKGWQLSGVLARLDAFQARQRPLLFSAPRERGMWAWGVNSIKVNGSAVRADLGEPEN